MTRWLWAGGDGSTVDLSAWGSGTHIIDEGTVGELSPSYQFVTDQFAGSDGAELRGITADPRTVTLGMDLTATDPTELRTRVRSLAHSLRPRAGIGSLTAVADDGSQRVLPCYYRKGLEAGTFRVSRYRAVLEFWSPSPWWRGVQLVANYGLAAPSVFFPILPVVLSASTIQGTQTFDLSDCDAPTFPIWDITGPGDTLTLTNVTTGQQLILNAPVLDGQIVRIDTRPGYQSVLRMVPGSFAETRRNLAPNPQPATGWTSWFANAGTGGAQTSSRPTTGGPDGGAFFRATWTTGNSTGAGIDPVASIVVDGRASAALPIPVSPGLMYSVAFQGRSSIAQRTAAAIQWYDAAGTSLSSSVSAADTVLTANTWTAFTVDGAIAPAGAAYARVALVTRPGAGVVPFTAGATLDMVYVILERANTSGTYFDGSTAATPTTQASWVGTANASASILETAQVLSPGASLFGSLASDPAMWPLVDGVNVVSALLTNAGTNSRVALTADRLYSGAR